MMMPETLIVAERAEKVRAEATRLCQEAAVALRLLEDLRDTSAELRCDLHTEMAALLARVRHADYIRSVE
jgi:hypothetical protein